MLSVHMAKEESRVEIPLGMQPRHPKSDLAFGKALAKAKDQQK